MRKLLEFLISKRHWFLFIILEIISFILIYRNNAYQRNIIFSSANVVTGQIASLSGSITSYINLREINRELSERNAELEMELLERQEELETLKADTTLFKGFALDSTEQSYPYDFVMSRVIYNSISYISNYITINKGEKDGIAPDMGVVSDKGVVGVVSTVSDHMAVVIPILNPKFKLSCKVKGNRYFGSMTWNGRSIYYANLEQLPRHVEFVIGDTIVTSGFSTIFPPGIIVGTVASFEKEKDDNFFSLEVKLSTDFASLNNVRILRNYRQKEQQKLEEVRKND
ncbi:MAG: rod shape-determining protein MreC [Massilibacteroides sp.]|nr:rod shape-determining protein MreC [Massilibacteroides sp.]MDD3062749.1 rod shape-determining protein MreC [Massilibacteroides sp.]MDD4115496.1 rod shape-determining protein MreC [Massilibacteroides sp.]MDD4661313.1 rod shape-determining protein MreC [Massilibacteroides sp.]